MNKLNTLLLLILIIFSLATCTKKDSGNVKILVHAPGWKNLKVKALTTDMVSLEQVVILETTLDSSGSAILEFKFDRPTFGLLTVGIRKSPPSLLPVMNSKSFWIVCKTVRVFATRAMRPKSTNILSSAGMPGLAMK